MVDDYLAGLIPAPHCQLCGAATASAPICAPCLTELPWNRAACPGCALPQAVAAPCPACLRRPRRFDSAWSALVHRGPARELVLGAKYGARFEQLRLLGHLLAQRLADRSEPWPQLLLPVPVHPRRLWLRGYNQALELGRALIRERPLPLAMNRLRRLRVAQDQIGLSAAQRRRNLRGAFAVTGRLDGLHVALLDDVMTTGSTLDELARVCRQAGAARIEAWTATREP